MQHSDSADFLRTRAVADIPKPRAILVVSAHWEAPTFTVMTAERPTMYYDYGGFPEESYKLRYPSPGSPEVATRVRAIESLSLTLECRNYKFVMVFVIAIA